MVRGKVVQIHLPDGNPKGIKICELPTSSIKAVFIPRGLIKDSEKYGSLEKVGIYFLLGEKNDVFNLKVYVGEAEVIKKRLEQHKIKDFWTAVVCFISEKNNLNKAHVKFLESYSYNELKDSGRVDLQNSNIPTMSNLSFSEKDIALTFFDEIKLILGTLGYPIFDKIIKQEKDGKLFCKVNNIKAEGSVNEEGFVVYKGSEAVLNNRKSSANFIKNLRERMIENEVLLERESLNKLIFTRDVQFTSPSLAASVVKGGNANGRKDWKNKKGISLKDLE